VYLRKRFAGTGHLPEIRVLRSPLREATTLRGQIGCH